METYKKKQAAKFGGARRENLSADRPMAGGMPSLTEGASRKELPDAMRTKMENAFGADFSNLNIVESEKVAEGGARAVTQGNTIAFAPGEFNVYSPSSEALLGHELSHVVSQARGESRGNGLLTDSYLEAKADREGVMAAAGQQVYSGPITPLSNSSPMSVAGPMQCKWGRGKKKKKAEAAPPQQVPQLNIENEPEEEIPLEGQGGTPYMEYESVSDATFDKDMEGYEAWRADEENWTRREKAHKKIFERLYQEHAFESAQSGDVGSIYFGGTNLTDRNDAPKETPKEGFRLLLANHQGPLMEYHPKLMRVNEKEHGMEYYKDKNIASIPMDRSGQLADHPSRGPYENIIKKDTLTKEDYMDLFYAVKYAERLHGGKQLEENEKLLEKRYGEDHPEFTQMSPMEGRIRSVKEKKEYVEGERQRRKREADDARKRIEAIKKEGKSKKKQEKPLWMRSDEDKIAMEQATINEYENWDGKVYRPDFAGGYLSPGYDKQKERNMADRSSLFMYGFLKSHPKLRHIPLNMRDFQNLEFRGGYSLNDRSNYLKKRELKERLRQQGVPEEELE